MKELRIRVACKNCGRDNWIFSQPNRDRHGGKKLCTYCKEPIRYFASTEQGKVPKRLYG